MPIPERVGPLNYEVTFQRNTVQEIESSETAWAFVYVDITHESETVARLTDFLYKNVSDLHRLTAALADREPLEITHHDNGGNIIEVLAYQPERVAVAFEWAASPLASGVWLAIEELQTVCVELLRTFEALVTGLNPDVAERVAVAEKRTAAERLVKR